MVLGLYPTKAQSSQYPRLPASTDRSDLTGKMSLPAIPRTHPWDWYTLQGINISHLGKRKIIFKMPFWGDMLVSWRVYLHEWSAFNGKMWLKNITAILNYIVSGCGFNPSEEKICSSQMGSFP